MELSKNYTPSSVEEKWSRHWQEKQYFRSRPDARQPFTVVIPPPNVTGVLHMGHTLNETVQDILVRKARMSGFNACWVPGSDHASIATEARVVAMLNERGIKKNDLSRAEFLNYAYEWKEKYGGIIYNQIEKLGCSVDWERVTFTMDDHYYKSVIKVFVDLYRKDLIYRGARMINWDPTARTALSDEEVEYRDVQGKLYYLKYFLDQDNSVTPGPSGSPDQEYITIATQRPETIMGDTAICVNPSDPRYAHLKDRHVFVPLINRRIPVIFDEYVSLEFGTGVLKVTPAHDINDYNLGLKHNLEVIDTLNEDGTLSEAAEIFVGEERFAARKHIIEVLQERNLIVKEEEHPSRLGFSQRTGVVVEPRISTQWFLRMKDMSAPALTAVTSGDIQIHPAEKFLATYRYWMENLKDWCISRQLWWGHQIPAWYDDDGKFVVAANEEEATVLFNEQYGAPRGKLRQDADVLDTWFSSWLWPMEVFKGISQPDNDEIKYYYPGAVLVTGQDIIFFWVARMIMAGMEYRKQKPFEHVYFTGMVRDKLGRKMSKSLGNSPDLLDLIDKYGADAVRFGIMISSPAGNDLLFDESSLEQGRNFNNKIWNAVKLVRMWSARIDASQERVDSFATEWFENRLNAARLEVDGLMKQFRLSEALKIIYSLIWDDFCSWYLEWVKPGFEQPVPSAIYSKTIGFFTDLLQLLHPFMPFITEEVYHLLAEREDDLCVRQFRPPAAVDDVILGQGRLLMEVITAVRDTRTKNRLKPREEIEVFVQTTEKAPYQAAGQVLKKQINAKSLSFTDVPVGEAISIVTGMDTLFISAAQPLDTTGQKEDLLKELDYLKGFVLSVDKKLGNERFMQNARPDVIALEKRKKADAEAKIKNLEEGLARM